MVYRLRNIVRCFGIVGRNAVPKEVAYAVQHNVAIKQIVHGCEQVK